LAIRNDDVNNNGFTLIQNRKRKVAEIFIQL
jgi:hypothetical protein